jgi:repressor LexA
MKEWGETRRQAILDFITAHTEQEGYPPTMAQIGKAVGMGSKSTVHHHLSILIAEGRIQQVGPRKFLVVTDA